MSGPLIGGAIKDSFAANGSGGFRETCDIMSFCAAGFSVFYFFANILPYLIAGSPKKKAVPVKVQVQDQSEKSLIVEDQDVSLGGANLKQFKGSEANNSMGSRTN